MILLPGVREVKGGGYRDSGTPRVYEAWIPYDISKRSLSGIIPLLELLGIEILDCLALSCNGHEIYCFLLVETLF